MRKLIYILSVSLFGSCVDDSRHIYKGPREKAVIDLSSRHTRRHYNLFIEDTSNTSVYRTYDELDINRIERNVYNSVDSSGEGAARIVDYKIRSARVTLDGIEYGVFIVSLSDEPENFDFHVVNLSQDKAIKKYDQ